MGFGNNIGLGMLMKSATKKTESADFDAFMSQIKGNVPINSPLFLVDGDFWNIYVCSFPRYDRQEYTCNCCKAFIRNYGGLVYIDAITGDVKSALWDTSKDYGYFNNVVRRMNDVVTGNAIDRQFFSKEKFLGRPMEGGWSHLSIPTPEGTVTKDLIYSADQVMAQSKENFRMLQRALNKHETKSIYKALTMIRSDQLFRPEKVLGQAEWFAGIKDLIAKHPGKRSAIVWAAVSQAPAGFCNVNSSAFGSLIDDISSNRMSDTMVKNRFNEKMDPLKYRRPQTAPGAQNVKRGEEIFRKLGLERSVVRRYARLEDLQLEWSPRPQKAVQTAGIGLFANVKTRDESDPTPVQNTAGVTTMTFAKFAKKILPHAERIRVQVPGTGSFSALCTAVHEDAPNILQWSNPVSWYVYGGGSTASQWGLRGGQWIDSTGICYQPNMWDDEAEHQGEGVFFLLEGCKDSRNAGLALFPEILSSELHEVRKTIESFSNSGQMQGRHRGNANGIKFGQGAKNLMVKVVSKGIETTYKLDRMD